jgi:hypothetical protein
MRLLAKKRLILLKRFSPSGRLPVAQVAAHRSPHSDRYKDPRCSMHYPAGAQMTGSKRPLRRLARSNDQSWAGRLHTLMLTCDLLYGSKEW